MSDFFLDIASAISVQDDALRHAYTIDGAGTIYYAFTLMSLKSAWQATCDQDSINAVLASYGPGGAAEAAYWQGRYQTDTECSDAQSNVWETLIQGGQTDVDNDSDARKNNFSLASGLAGTSASFNNLFIGFNV